MGGTAERRSLSAWSRAPTRALGRWGVVSTGLLIVAGTAWLVGFFDFAVSGHLVAGDFKNEYLPAAHAVMHGQSPYPALDTPVFDVGRVYVYPPLVAFLSIPFSLLPGPVCLATALVMLCVPLSLRLFGVRDWRCYLAALLWLPTFNGIQTANMTLPLLLGCAVCWGYRDRPAVISGAGGLTVAAKLLAWPMVLWLAATRRFLSAAAVLMMSLVVTLSLWAAIGFAGLADFPRNLHRLQQSDGRGVYTISTLAWDAGVSAPSRTLLSLGLAFLALVGVIGFGRRGDDARSFSCAMVAAILASPIVWLHSFTFLLAPLALLRPRFSVVWLLPAAMWLFDSGSGVAAPWQIALTLVLAGAVAIGTLAPAVPGSALIQRAVCKTAALGLRLPPPSRLTDSLKRGCYQSRKWRIWGRATPTP
jgi:hypothetical protein